MTRQKILAVGSIDCLAVLALSACSIVQAQTAPQNVSVGQTPMAIAVNPVTHKVYVISEKDSTVTVIDGATLSTSVIKTGAGPEGIAVNPVTNKIYTANSSASAVSVIDGATGTVTDTVKTGSYCQSLVVNPVTNKIYVANNFGHSVTVIDGATNSATTLHGRPGASRDRTEPRREQSRYGELWQQECDCARRSDERYHLCCYGETSVGSRGR